MRLAAPLVVVSLTLTACSSAGSEVGSLPAVEPPFDACLAEQQPAAEGPRVVLETGRSQAPGSIAFTWADDVTTVGPDVLVECWTGSAWQPVWIVRSAQGGASTDLVLSEDDLQSNEIALEPAPGRLLIPAEAPPGWYRVGGGPSGERGADFEVTP